MHEPFLKELGVREEPSAADYVHFLRDLAYESRDTALNPNELRAVVSIVQNVLARMIVLTDCIHTYPVYSLPPLSISLPPLLLPQVRIVQAVAVRRSEESQARELQTTDLASPSPVIGATDHVYVPDRDSYLREARWCVANDDEWLSIRLMGPDYARGLHATGGGNNGGGMSLYVLHPSVSLSVASQLNIPRIR